MNVVDNIISVTTDKSYRQLLDEIFTVGLKQKS